MCSGIAWSLKITCKSKINTKHDYGIRKRIPSDGDEVVRVSYHVEKSDIAACKIELAHHIPHLGMFGHTLLQPHAHQRFDICVPFTN